MYIVRVNIKKYCIYWYMYVIEILKAVLALSTVLLQSSSKVYLFDKDCSNHKEVADRSTDSSER